jgi:hypothetical protein
MCSLSNIKTVNNFLRTCLSYHLLSTPQNFCGNFFRGIGTCRAHAQSVRIDQKRRWECIFGGGAGMNRAKYEPSSACIHHHPGGPNRHHPCSHQYDARLPSTKAPKFQCFSGWIPDSIPVLLQGFLLTTLGGGLDIRTSVGQIFAALIGKDQCWAGIGFKENMQSLGYCIFFINFD